MLDTDTLAMNNYHRSRRSELESAAIDTPPGIEWLRGTELEDGSVCISGSGPTEWAIVSEQVDLRESI